MPFGLEEKNIHIMTKYKKNAWHCWADKCLVFNINILFSITRSQTAAQSQGVDDCVEPEQNKKKLKLILSNHGRNIKRGSKLQKKGRRS